MKEALYLVHAEPDPSFAEAWNGFHAKEHVPMVVKAAGFEGAQRFRWVGTDGKPLDPPKFTTAYRASGLGVVRAYLEGGEVGRMRAHQDAFVAGRRIVVSREVLEENYAVDETGSPRPRIPDAPSARAAFVARARVELDTVAGWSAWYDREHMPAVARAGFLRATRYRVVDEAASAPRFAIVYEAATVDAVLAFRAEAGPRFAKEHEDRFGGKITVERALWSLVG